jgi:alkylation response protein AidB-like acyl-CoA dehydrogenase
VTIRHPSDTALSTLSDDLRALAPALDAGTQWPDHQMRLCAEAGVCHWFLPESLGGVQWSSEWLMQGYMALARGCTTTAFLITQRAAAIRRILGSENERLVSMLLPAMIGAEDFVTVGISQLATSQRHLGKPAVIAERDGAGWRLSGCCPWVSGVDRASWVAVGAVTSAGDVVEVLVDTRQAQVRPSEINQLTSLSASRTGRLILDGVVVSPDCILSGPKRPGPVLQTGTGGLHTSALAMGLVQRAIDSLTREAERRPELVDATTQLRSEAEGLTDALMAVARGGSGDPIALRVAANLLVNRATNAALIAAKGAGYLAGHPASQACREALFFWVWSCPSAVTAACLRDVTYPSAT